jgi:hypothetical protein
MFERDVSEHLRVGENVIAIFATQYRRRGQMPVAISLDPKEVTQSYRRDLDLANGDLNGAVHTGWRDVYA